MRPLSAFALILLLPSAPGRSATPSPQTQEVVVELTPSHPIERELSGGQAHGFSVRLEPGAYLHAVVDQHGIDVVVSLFAPDGRRLADIDSPNGSEGPEPVFWVAQESGAYRLEVRSLNREAAPGRYAIRIVDLRPATPEDRLRVQADEIYRDAEALKQQETAASSRLALEKYRAALPLWQRLAAKAQETLTLQSMGWICYQLGENEEALAYASGALSAARAVQDRDSEASALNILGLIYDSRADRQKALDFFEQALALARSTGNGAMEAMFLTNIGSTYDDLGEYPRALDYYDQALPLRHARGDAYGEAYTLSDIGLAYFRLGEKEKALEYYEQALPLRWSAGDQPGEAETLTFLGILLVESGQPRRGLNAYTAALGLRHAAGDFQGESFTLTMMGAAYNALGDPDRAAECLEQAICLTASTGRRSGEGEARFHLARSERDRGRLEASREQIEASLAIVESLRSGLSRSELRTSYFASVRARYEFSIDLLMRLHEREPSRGFDAMALGASDRACARSLLDLLTEARADVRRGADARLLERRSSLRQLLTSRSERLTRLSAAKEMEEISRASQELDALVREYERLEAQIRAMSPRYAALTQPEPLSLKEIQKQVVDSETLLLEYSLGEERSFLWAVTPDSLKSYVLPKRSRIEDAASRLSTLLTARSRKEKFETATQRRARLARADAEAAQIAASLSQTLLGPVSGRLEGKRLLVVADGALQYIPFAALPEPGMGVSLLAHHEIVHLPSASTLAILRRELRGRRSAAKTLAVFADPVFEKADGRVRFPPAASGPQNTSRTEEGSARDGELLRSARDVGLAPGGELRIPRLPFTRQEAVRASRLVPEGQRRLALDFDASRTAATSPELAQYRFVHFATHGFLNSVHPELSGLVLSLVDRDGRPQQGFLPALDVFNLNLPADLVVLSGCRTGLGKEIRGEGLVGLTRAFFYAGTARVIVSLWDVNDEATAELMSRFYAAMLTDGLSPGTALRRAQLSISREKRWSAPFYWAAFVLQGEPRP